MILIEFLSNLIASIGFGLALVLAFGGYKKAPQWLRITAGVIAAVYLLGILI